VTLTGRVEKDKCKPVKVPALVSADRLSKPFIHRATMRDGNERTVDLSEGSDTFTPLDQISPYMVASVMSTEDGGFWKHKGFITSQFQAALRRNLEAGKIRLGASTITMQMVKNVLLSHERTLSRKLQEMFLTWYVEQSLTKQRIMEIYLNVIEFGPGIYGVTRAAQHYYGKLPLDLTPPEAAYLALMLPSPVRRHVNYCEGGLTPVFQAKMKRLLSIMHTKGRLDPETYEVWKEGEITFDPSDLESKQACNAEISGCSRRRSSSGRCRACGATAIDDDAIPIGEDVVDAAPAKAPTGKGKKKQGFDEAALDALGDDAFMQAAER
jgi:membrane peptidoglycan carboxypeptidase